MDVAEAYDLTMAAIKELRAEGIAVKITPSRSRNIPEVVASHSGTGYLPVEQWIWVEFIVQSAREAQQVAEARKHLGWRGIGFDTGGMGMLRDWCLDWSFRVEEVPDGEWEHRADVVEGILETGIDAHEEAG